MPTTADMLTTERQLPSGWVLRKVSGEDFNKGHPELLAQLAAVGELTPQQYASALKEIQQQGSSVMVVEDVSGKVVASATLLIERKIIHGTSRVGHIEDVVVHCDCRGQGVGEFLIQSLVDLATSAGCYKVILDCSDAVAGFYERCGFVRKEIQMRRDTKPLSESRAHDM